MFELISHDQCMQRTEIAKQLEQKYEEVPSAAGTAENGAIVELFATIDGKTWTIVFNNGDGTACLIASGTDWQRRKNIVKPMGPQL